MRRLIPFLSLLCTFSLFTVAIAFRPAYSADPPPPCGKGTQGNRFVLFDNGTLVCDNASGLVWERVLVNVQRSFADATAYCAAKGPGWTVPGIKDFFTVVDYAASNPPLPSGHPFEIPVNGSVWSRTPRVNQPVPDEVWTFLLDWGRTFSVPRVAAPVWSGVFATEGRWASRA